MITCLSNASFKHLYLCFHTDHLPFLCLVFLDGLLSSTLLSPFLFTSLVGLLTLALIPPPFGPSPHGYSWFDGLLRNPQSGVQTPQVLGYSGMRVALILGLGFKPLRDGVILRGRGLGSHMSNQGTLWRRFPGRPTRKTIQPTWDRTPGVGQHRQLVSHQ